MNSFTLKIIAVVSMVIDHVGVMFFPEYRIFDIIGRISFPIFAYLLVEGFCYTHDVKKYMLRMSALALISEIPFDLARTGKVLEFGHQNVFFTLFLGLAMLYWFLKIFGTAKQFLCVMVFMLIAEFLHTDYSSMGLLMIFCFYLFRDKMREKIISVCVINILFMGYSQIYGALAAIPIACHNRQQGPKMKYFFYGFYPVHLLILYLIKVSI